MARIKITVERIEGYCNLNMLVGDQIFVDGSKLSIPEGKFMCIWALQSMMPVFPIFKEKKMLSEDHWVRGVKHFSCPDPKGRVIYRLELVD